MDEISKIDGERQTPYQKWLAEITASEKSLKKFHERGRVVVKKFIDERASENSVAKFFNVFYANTSILESALYAQLPKPSVSRTNKDYQDDVARVAAMMLQRTITQDLDDPRDTFDATMRQCVQDRLVSGMSMAWLRLETDTSPIEDVILETGVDTEEVGEIEGEDVPEQITDQRVITDYVYWEDFLFSPCRVYDERRWVGRKVYMDREALVDRFNAKGKLVPLDYDPKKLSNSICPQFDDKQKAVVYEIWDRTTRKVVWLAKGMDELLDERDDPLGLVGFEPCPRPMLANTSTSNCMPRPDYYMIQDQYTELDVVNNRISLLVQACKVVGVYDKASTGVQRMLQEGTDNTLIPVDNWAMFAEKNGLKGQIDWLPLGEVIAALDQLNRSRETIKAQIYELTGISDIVRGASKASETLGAQQIKAQFAGVRIKRLQDEVARFAGDIMRIKAEIQVKHFTPEIMVKKSNVETMGSDAQLVPQALALLQSTEGFEWRIKVQADSLAQADYAAEKEERSAFMTSVGTYMGKMLPMVQQYPGTLELVVSLLKWGVSSYRNSSEIEAMLDQQLDILVQESKKPKQPPPPSPEEVKAKAESDRMQQQAQIDQQKAQQDMQVAQMQAQMEQQAKQQELMLEQQRFQMEAQAEQQRLQMELMAEQQRQALEQQSQQMALMFQQAMQTLKLQGQKEMQEAKAEAAEEAAEAKGEPD